MEKIDNILNSKTNSYTVNSKDKSLTTVNSNTVNSKTISQKISDLLDENNVKPEGVAKMIAEQLDDMKSIAYYEILAKNNNPELLLDTAHYVCEVDRQGKIRISKAVYYMAVLRRKGVVTKFKK